MAGFSRPEGGWRINFGGVKTNDTPDAYQPTEFPYAQNIRRYKDNSVQTRPGYTLQFITAGVPITDFRAYSALETDNLPRYLVRNGSNQIYLDTGTLVTTLSGSSLGAFFIPYRPQQSPQSWMYIGAQQDYIKISAPDSDDVVTVHKVGIAEQQDPPEACPEPFNFYEFSAAAADWNNGGNAGAPSDQVRLADTLGSVLEDPASGAVKRCSCVVTATEQYQMGMTVEVDGSITAVVQDVLPPVNAGTNITVESIFYYAGTSGRCVIVPTQQAANPSVPTITNNIPIASSIYSDSVLSSLRRGAVINLDNGAADEDLFILSVTVGPNGAVCFEVETVATYAAGNSIIGLPAISLSGVTSANTGDTIEAVAVQSTLTGSGIGTLDQDLATNPFDEFLDPSTRTPQQDDYIGFTVNISDLSKFILGTVIFNTDPGTPAYDVNGFFAQFDASNLVFHKPAASLVTQTEIDNPNFNPNQDSTIDQDGNIQEPTTIVTSNTPLPSDQYTTILFPIRQLQRLGNDLTKTLADCNGIQIKMQVSDTVVLQIGSFFVSGGGQPDVGPQGTPYFYVVRGRDPETGAKSNPSPMTRYGVSPRRQQVRLTMQDTTADPQMKVWDVFRYGGSVNSMRYLGTVPNSGGTDVFIDNFYDGSALGGSLVEYDNTEPWPTVDVPYQAEAGAISGITTLIRVVGTSILVIYYAGAPFTSPAPDTILRWLPGTLISIGGQAAYTLWNRPTAVTLAAPPTANYYAYLLQVTENIGTLTPAVLDIAEPFVANQDLPYLFGPDAAGTVFGCGDPLRPGNVYYCKGFTPDSAPSAYNLELTPPSEPMTGGEIINGVAMVASTERWWALYPDFGSPRQRYQPVQRPVGRGLAAPYGHCSDGKNIYFVAKDGIWATAGGEGKSLTDADLFTLFPHEGINTPANYSYAGYTLYAPDYKYAASFRLSVGNGFLYFDYLDSTGTARTLTCDLTGEKPIWCPDVYGASIRRHYTVEQQESTLLTSGSRYPLTLLGDTLGNIYSQTPNSNDEGTSIACVLSSFEYNGGDIRAGQLFNDCFVDVTPISGLTVRLVSGGALVGSAKTVAASDDRVQTNAPSGLELKFMGVLFNWTDDFDDQDSPTMIHAWQPMYQSVPVSVFLWKTQKTSFGWPAFGHLRQWNFAYRADAEVIINITAYDGTSPEDITLPATSGEVVKIMVPFTFNKGQLYDFEGTSEGEWTPYLSESELFCGAWGREDGYQLVHDIEGPKGLRS